MQAPSLSVGGFEGHFSLVDLNNSINHKFSKAKRSFFLFTAVWRTFKFVCLLFSIANDIWQKLKLRFDSLTWFTTVNVCDNQISRVVTHFFSIAKKRIVVEYIFRRLMSTLCKCCRRCGGGDVVRSQNGTFTLLSLFYYSVTLRSLSSPPLLSSLLSFWINRQMPLG